MTRPERRRRAVLLCLATAVVLTFVCDLIRMPHIFEWGDEGFFANGAMRVLSGEVIYRDFQHNYPPGRLFSLAFLLGLFGENLLVIRIFWCALHSAAVGLGFLAARRIMPVGFAFVAAVSVTFNMAHMNKSAELAAAALVLFALARCLERPGRDLATGALLALAGLFRQDLGLVAVALYALSLILQAWRPGQLAGDSFGERLGARLGGVRLFLAGYGLVALPLFLYLLAFGALGNAAHDVLFSGFLGNRAMSLPFPPLAEEWSLSALWAALPTRGPLFYAPPLVYAAGGVMGLRGLHRNGSAGSILVVLASLLGAALFLQVLPRSDWGHLQKSYLPAHLMSIFLVAAGWSRFLEHFRGGRSWRAVSSLVLCIALLLLPVAQLRQNLMTRRSIVDVVGSRHDAEPVEFPRGTLWLPAADAEKLRRLVRAVDESLASGEPSDEQWLFSFPSGALFNFLFGIPTPLRYDILRPGELRNNDPEIVEEILSRLRSTRPRFLLRTGEGSNRELSRRILASVRDDYRRHEASYVELWVKIPPPRQPSP